MKKITKIRIITYIVLGVFIAALLIGLGIKSNLSTNEARYWKGTQNVVCANVSRIEREDAPLGVAVKYDLDLHSMNTDTKLIFNSSHSFVEVYVEDELVYSLKNSDEIKTVETPGGNWNIVPLYREDSQKNCTVVLMPVYESFLEQTLDFKTGSVHAVFVSLLMENLPEIFVTALVMFIGLAFLCFGLYFAIKTKKMIKLLPLGAFAISVSLWRFCDFTFTTLISGGKSIFIYYVSLTMLMITMIPLLETVKQSFSKKMAKAFDALALIIGVAGIAQLILQVFNVSDLRQMLSLTHLTIIASLVLIFVALVIQLIRPDGKRTLNHIFIVILGIGTDLLLFYLRSSSAGLVFTLLSILIFVLIEGTQFIKKYLEQQNRLVESEIKIAYNEAKLAESRFTMMMSQIRSHFVFNILNAISGMCKYDPEKADKTIVHFARFLRSNIDIMQNEDLVHFHNALRHLEDYVALEQVRYGDKIRFETDIEEDDFVLPPLVMQPVVENSIKHGLVGKPTGGTITLRTRKDADNIYIIIEDDGIGYDDSREISEKSIGIQNIRFRLRHMINGELKIESIVNIGTKTTITIPRKEADRCG